MAWGGALDQSLEYQAPTVTVIVTDVLTDAMTVIAGVPEAVALQLARQFPAEASACSALDLDTLLGAIGERHFVSRFPGAVLLPDAHGRTVVRAATPLVLASVTGDGGARPEGDQCSSTELPRGMCIPRGSWRHAATERLPAALR